MADIENTPKKRTRKKDAAEALTYEQAMARLEEIVKLLEQGDSAVSLDMCMKLYEEGVTLVNRLHTELQAAEQKVQILQKTPEGIVTVPFASTDDE